MERNLNHTRLHRSCSQLLILMLLASFSSGFVDADEGPSSRIVNPATLTSNVSSTTVQVAEALTLELTVTSSVGSKVNFPSIGTSLGKFDVIDQVDRSDVPSPNDVRQRTWILWLTLESIITGDMEIPSLEIQVLGSGGDIQTLRSDVVPIHVISVLEDRADPTQFRGIKSVVDMKLPDHAPTSYGWLWWTLGSAGVALATLVLVAVRKQKTWLMPNVWAVRELERLRSADAFKSGSSEIVAENLTTILRDYLELQFDITSSVQTTAELLQKIKSHKLLKAGTIQGYTDFFENTDLARFAGLRLSPAELTKAVDDAQQLIEQTTNDLQCRSQGENAAGSKRSAAKTAELR
ncbi:MAG: BatD family protein [Planctomycetota bacterium]|nr:BatD family protein [Planctomycetota bacterium]